jgi:hypothetical protein
MQFVSRPKLRVRQSNISDEDEEEESNEDELARN